MNNKRRKKKESFNLKTSKRFSSFLVLSRLWVAMTRGNGSDVTEFYLLGFAAQQEFHYVLFIVFLVIYMTSMVGNTGIILLINTDSRLQTPMYFFLQHLAFVDICYTSAITPKMLKKFMYKISRYHLENA
jgi:hypothetical protein